jgi:hypothetical protein
MDDCEPLGDTRPREVAVLSTLAHNRRMKIMAAGYMIVGVFGGKHSPSTR